VSTTSRSGRRETLTRRLAHAGFADLTRSASLWAEPALQEVLDDESGEAGEAVLADLGRSADPDLALLQLVRLAENGHARVGMTEVLRAPAGSAGAGLRARLVAVLGASSALGDEVVRRPELLDALGPAPERGADAPRDDDEGDAGEEVAAGRLTAPTAAASLRVSILCLLDASDPTLQQ
jgi:glutamate-ammonia-ligase adenylyltransferase